MSNETNDMHPEGLANGQFDQLVTLILRMRASGAIMPDPESVVAFITGTASAAQTEEVERALADSSDFQHLYLDLVASIEKEPTAEERELFRTMHVPRLNLVEKVIRHSRQAHSGDGRQSHWRRLLDRFSLRLWVPATVAAVAVLIVFVSNPSLQFWRLPESMSRQMELDPAFFASDVIRGQPTLTEPLVDTSAQDAALRKFREALTVDYTSATAPRYMLRPSDSVRAVTPGSTITIVLTARPSKESETISVVLPPTVSVTGDGAVTAWVLAVPALEVWSQTLDSDSIVIESPLEDGMTGILTVTYPETGGFQATPAKPLGNLR